MSKVELLEQLQSLALCGSSLDDLMPELAEVEYLAALANEMYRDGCPCVEDWFYDQYLIEALKIVNPDSAFLREVEPEPEGVFGKTVPLPERMLSTQKAYSVAEIEKWYESVLDAAAEFDIKHPEIRVTPKLDGFAVFDAGDQQITRGNGVAGTDISHAFRRGVQVFVKHGTGAPGGKGELVVNREHFAKHLSGKFENTRNVIAAAIKEGELNPDIRRAIACGAIAMMPFSNLNGWRTSYLADVFTEDGIGYLWKQMVDDNPYDTDGLVFEATSPAIKEKMGSTNHHHRWQIAFKKNVEFHNIRVTGLTWQTGKSGKITPVVELEPTRVSGVTISRATGHHYGNVISKCIDEGAIVRVCRSGQVIPYIADVIEPAKVWRSPACCPSCDSVTEVRGDFLHCTNEATCPAQIERTIEHFFKTIGTCDGFGPKVVEQVCDYWRRMGIKASIRVVYTMTLADFTAAGISDGIAKYLIESIWHSKRTQIEDWRFLAAFSIPSVGKGGCERLLKHHRIEDIFSLSVGDVVKIDGFAERTASVLVNTLVAIRPDFEELFPQFNLKRTPIGGQGVESPIAGTTVVFTGTMLKESRSDMEKQAKDLGAKVGSSVSGKTDYLIAGLNVGANKTAAAEKHGVKVLTEDEYLQLIAV